MVKGQDIVNAVKQGDKIISVKILRIGEKAKQFKSDQPAFDSLMKNFSANKDKSSKDAKAKLQEAYQQKMAGLADYGDRAHVQEHHGRKRQRLAEYGVERTGPLFGQIL